MLFLGKKQFIVTVKVKDKPVTACSKSAMRRQNNIHGCHSSIFIVGFKKSFSHIEIHGGGQSLTVN